MANAKDHVSKVNVMKEEFGWDIPVELVPIPSMGLLYDPESNLYRRESVKIKSMTAREEDILSSTALIKEGTVIDHLINSCLLDDIDAKDMLVGDRNALMVAIRITGYGPEYPVSGTCDKCDTQNQFSVDLSSLPIKRLKIDPVEPGRNEFSFKLPVTKKTVYFKIPTLREERDRAERERNLRRHLEGAIETNVTGNLETVITRVENTTDKNKIKHFIMNMPAFDSRKLRAFIRDCEPGMDMQCEFTCSNCGHKNKSAIPVTSEFFWPST